MDIDTLRHYLDDDAQAARWLRRLGVTDVRRGHDNLVRMATRGMTLDLLRELALLRHMCAGLDPTAALRMATGAGGDALGLPVGRLRVGVPLDAVIFSAPSGGVERRSDRDLSEWLTAGIRWEEHEYLIYATHSSHIARLDLEVSAGGQILLDNVSVQEVAAEVHDPDDDSLTLVQRNNIKIPNTRVL